MVPQSAGEVFDPLTGSVEPTGVLVQPRHGHTATLLSDGRVVLIGGEEFVDPGIEPRSLLSSAEIFTPWALVVEDGGVLATDSAPDVGSPVASDDLGLPLLASAWSVEREIEGGAMSVVSTIIFENDGTISVDAGCNTGTANVTIGTDTVLVTDLVLTENECRSEVMDFEAMVLDVLSADEITYALDAGVLELSSGGNTVQFQGASTDGS